MSVQSARSVVTGLLALAVFIGSVGAEAAEGQVPLIEAIKQADLGTVRALVDQGADVNASEVDGTTALHWAVHRDDLETVELLIRVGANVTATNRYGVAPISLACINGSAAMLDRLLEAGADVNASLLEGETALMTAARTGRVEAVTVLLDHGAAVDATEQYRGQTALMWAAAEGQVAVVQELIDRGADIDIRSGRSAEEASASSSPAGDTDASADSASPAVGFSAFLFAVRGGHLDAATVLADAGANVNDTAPDGSSALVVAVDNRNYELAAWLLGRGADPNAGGVGWTALHTAVLAHRPHFRVVPNPIPTGTLDSFGVLEALMANGADPNAHATKRVRLAAAVSPLFDTVGATPFMLAAVAADVPVMRLFLAHGADPSVTTPAGSTSSYGRSGGRNLRMAKSGFGGRGAAGGETGAGVGRECERGG